MCDLISAEFIQGVSQFSVKGEKEKKLRCEWHKHTHTHTHTLCMYVPTAVHYLLYNPPNLITLHTRVGKSNNSE